MTIKKDGTSTGNQYVGFRLDRAIAERLEAMSRDTGLSKTDLFREAVVAFLDKRQVTSADFGE